MEFRKAASFTTLLTIQNLVYGLITSTVLLYYVSPSTFATIALYTSINNALVVLVSTGFGSLLLGTLGITMKMERAMFGRVLLVSVIIAFPYWLILYILTDLGISSIYWVLHFIVSAAIVVPKAILYRRKLLNRLMWISLMSNCFGGITLIIVLLLKGTFQLEMELYILPLIVSSLVTFVFGNKDVNISPIYTLRLDTNLIKSSYSFMGGKLVSSQFLVLTNYFCLFLFGSYGLGIVSRSEQFGMMLPRLFKKAIGNLGIIYLSGKNTLEREYKRQLELLKLSFFSFYICVIIIAKNIVLFYRSSVPFEYHDYIDHIFQFGLVSVFSLMNNVELSVLKTLNLGTYYVRNEIFKGLPVLLGFLVIWYFELSFENYVFLVGLKLVAEYMINHYKYSKLAGNLPGMFINVFYIIISILLLLSENKFLELAILLTSVFLAFWSLRRCDYGKKLV